MVGSELLCVNLAVVDFLCCICFYPLSILSSFRHAWLGEKVTCVYYGLGCYVFGLCGMFTITAISVFRYLKTCCSLAYGEGQFEGFDYGSGDVDKRAKQTRGLDGERLSICRTAAFFYW